MTEVIVLPGASSAEGVAAGPGPTFYAGDLVRGDIFRGDLEQGTAELFIDAPEGRKAMGMAVDVAHGLLFVAGFTTGQGYVYATHSGATVTSYQFGNPPTSLVNDVASTSDGAWFTESRQARLYFVPVSQASVPEATFRTLAISGPATSGESLNVINGMIGQNILLPGEFCSAPIAPRRTTRPLR
jgi:hypothetical protein